jgi:hypothetical protein
LPAFNLQGRAAASGQPVIAQRAIDGDSIPTVEIGIRVGRLHLLPDLAIVKVYDDLVSRAFNADDVSGNVWRFGCALCA